jgi:Putative transposase
LAHVPAIVRARVGQLLARRQLEPEDDHTLADPLTETSPILTGLRERLRSGAPRPGPRAGARVSCLGDGPDLGHLTSRDPRQAHLDGFDLHANAWVPPPNRPASSNSAAISSAPRSPRTASRPDGRALVKLKTVWRDGPSHFLFEPIEFLEKLAALIPRPAVNLLLYHGVLASRDSR